MVNICNEASEAGDLNDELCRENCELRSEDWASRLGFRVLRSGKKFRVSSSSSGVGIRVRLWAFRVLSSEFMVLSLGFRGSGLRVQL